MYLAIDIGGTKTLLAIFSEDGTLKDSHKFPTNHDYHQFKTELLNSFKENFSDYKITNCCCAVPGFLDRQKGIAIAFGNLDWTNIPIQQGLEELLNLPVIIENDANLAGLSEAQLVLDRYKEVVYITISTGIGGGIITNGVLNKDFLDFEPGQMIFEHDGKTQVWEKYASGKAIYEKYKKKASEINDQATWGVIVKDFSIGLYDVIATVRPDVVIIGGGVGTHFHKYSHVLEKELHQYNNKIVPIPPILPAKRSEEAVIYGCYELIQQNLATAS